MVIHASFQPSTDGPGSDKAERERIIKMFTYHFLIGSRSDKPRTPTRLAPFVLRFFSQEGEAVKQQQRGRLSGTRVAEGQGGESPTPLVGYAVPKIEERRDVQRRPRVWENKSALCPLALVMSGE